MKKLLTLLVLAFLLAGTASAQHYRGGWQHQRHGGHGGWGWVAPAVIGAGITYLVTRPIYVEPPPAVYYEPLPRVIMAPQPAPQQTTSACHREERKVFDEKGQPLGTQVFLVCPVISATPPAQSVP